MSTVISTVWSASMAAQMAVTTLSGTTTVDEKTEKLFREKLSPDPKIRAFLHDYVELGKAMNGKK